MQILRRGCGVYAGVTKGRVVAIKGDKDNWNKGFLCIKGYYLPPILYANDRLKYPMLKKDGKFVRISWKEAMDLMTEKFAGSIKNHGQTPSHSTVQDRHTRKNPMS